MCDKDRGQAFDRLRASVELRLCLHDHEPNFRLCYITVSEPVKKFDLTFVTF